MHKTINYIKKINDHSASSKRMLMLSSVALLQLSACVTNGRTSHFNHTSVANENRFCQDITQNFMKKTDSKASEALTLELFYKNIEEDNVNGVNQALDSAGENKTINFLHIFAGLIKALQKNNKSLDEIKIALFKKIIDNHQLIKFLNQLHKQNLPDLSDHFLTNFIKCVNVGMAEKEMFMGICKTFAIALEKKSRFTLNNDTKSSNKAILDKLYMVFGASLNRKKGEYINLIPEYCTVLRALIKYDLSGTYWSNDHKVWKFRMDKIFKEKTERLSDEEKNKLEELFVLSADCKRTVAFSAILNEIKEIDASIIKDKLTSKTFMRNIILPIPFRKSKLVRVSYKLVGHVSKRFAKNKCTTVHNFSSKNKSQNCSEKFHFLSHREKRDSRSRGVVILQNLALACPELKKTIRDAFEKSIKDLAKCKNSTMYTDLFQKELKKSVPGII